MKLDHIAIKSTNIRKSISWYKEHFCKVNIVHEDDTWGLVDISGTKIAFVSSEQHSAHIGFEISKDQMITKFSDKVFKQHRDGTEGCYISDPDDNIIEFLVRDTDGKNKKI